MTLKKVQFMTCPPEVSLGWRNRKRGGLLQYKVNYYWLGKEAKVNELGQAKQTLVKDPINRYPTHFLH
jgi:hypothetical protein